MKPEERKIEPKFNAACRAPRHDKEASKFASPIAFESRNRTNRVQTMTDNM